jgi:hypothetical protein
VDARVFPAPGPTEHNRTTLQCRDFRRPPARPEEIRVLGVLAVRERSSDVARSTDSRLSKASPQLRIGKPRRTRSLSPAIPCDFSWVGERCISEYQATVSVRRKSYDCREQLVNNFAPNTRYQGHSLRATATKNPRGQAPALAYEPGGRRFESCRARQMNDLQPSNFRAMHGCEQFVCCSLRATHIRHSTAPPTRF